MGDILVRDLDTDTLAHLERRAGERGTSVEHVVRDLITADVPLSREVVMREIAAIRARAKASSLSAVEDVRAWRDGLDDPA